MEVEDLYGAGGLKMVWSLLDDAFDKVKSEKYDEAAVAYDMWRRTPGMSMDTYVQGLKKKKVLWMAQDDELVISTKAFAQKLLRGWLQPRLQGSQV